MWRLVILSKEDYPTPRSAKGLPNPEERCRHAAVSHQVWCTDGRHQIKVGGRWLPSILISDGYSRAIVRAGGFDRQHLSQLMQGFRQAALC